MSERIVAEINMTGLWKAPEVRLKSILLDYLTILDRTSALPEDWWKRSSGKMAAGMTLPLSVIQCDDGSLRIRISDEAIDLLLASA